MLAKAVATEGGTSFLCVDASSIENKWLGESEKNARAVFTLARKLAPCIIFMDEVIFLWLNGYRLTLFSGGLNTEHKRA